METPTADAPGAHQKCLGRGVVRLLGFFMLVRHGKMYTPMLHPPAEPGSSDGGCKILAGAHHETEKPFVTQHVVKVIADADWGIKICNGRRFMSSCCILVGNN